MAVKFGGECLFDLNHNNIFKTYCDLFMTVNKKEQSVPGYLKPETHKA